MRTILLLAMISFMAPCFAQTDTAATIIHYDKRVDSLYLPLRPELGWEVISRKVYRVLFDSVLSRDDAYRIKGELLSAYPDQQVYITYQSPVFKIKIGDFLSAEVAFLFKENMDKKSSHRLIVVPDVSNEWIKH